MYSTSNVYSIPTTICITILRVHPSRRIVLRRVVSFGQDVIFSHLSFREILLVSHQQHVFYAKSRTKFEREGLALNLYLRLWLKILSIFLVWTATTAEPANVWHPTPPTKNSHYRCTHPRLIPLYAWPHHHPCLPLLGRSKRADTCNLCTLTVERLMHRLCFFGRCVLPAVHRLCRQINLNFAMWSAYQSVTAPAIFDCTVLSNDFPWHVTARPEKKITPVLFRPVLLRKQVKTRLIIVCVWW